MASVDDLKRRACEVIDARAERLLEVSHRIHAHPELRFEEHRAAGWLVEFLEEVGLEVARPAFGLETGFAANAGSAGPVVAVLCEYDALPEIGHACGHNVIAAAGAGAAVGLLAVLDGLAGRMRVLGTPAEEGGGGKAIMARHGAFEGVDVAMMIHPSGLEILEINALAITNFEVEYRGKAAHAAAAPHNGINALDAMVVAYNAVSQLRQHIPSNQRVHGIITDGGQAANVVPERSAGSFSVRAANRTDLEVLEKRVRECFRAGAVATGAELTITKQGEDYDEMRSNPPLAALYEANLATLGRSVTGPAQVTGSTDMGNVSQIVPSIHPMLQIAPEDVPLHTREFARWAGSERGDRGVLDGAKLMAMTAIDYLSSSELREAVRVAFEVSSDESPGGANQTNT